MKSIILYHFGETTTDNDRMIAAKLETAGYKIINFEDTDSNDGRTKRAEARKFVLRYPRGTPEVGVELIGLLGGRDTIMAMDGIKGDDAHVWIPPTVEQAEEWLKANPPQKSTEEEVEQVLAPVRSMTATDRADWIFSTLVPALLLEDDCTRDRLLGKAEVVRNANPFARLFDC